MHCLFRFRFTSLQRISRRSWAASWSPDIYQSLFPASDVPTQHYPHLLQRLGGGGTGRNGRRAPDCPRPSGSTPRPWTASSSTASSPRFCLTEPSTRRHRGDLDRQDQEEKSEYWVTTQCALLLKIISTWNSLINVMYKSRFTSFLFSSIRCIMYDSSECIGDPGIV